MKSAGRANTEMAENRNRFASSVARSSERGVYPLGLLHPAPEMESARLCK